jgi:prophage DNA circulation protein
MSVLDQIFALSNPLATLTNYFTQLQPASFNGVPFVTRSNSTVVGRRVAEHIYPFRDQPWIEDVGRKARRYNIVGFLIGDDVISQRNAMQDALEYPGPGVLVHPTYGRLTVTALDQCTFEEDMTHGRVIEMRLVFEESGLQIFPATVVATGNAVATAAANANAAASDDFVSQVTDAVKSGAQAAGQALTTASVWIGDVQTLGNDAANITHLASGLVGGFGRFFGGSTGSGSGSITGSYVSPSQISSQVANLVNAASADRANITSGITSLTTVLGGL